ncbi:MAG: ABC transporter permease [Pseudomonadota bacterium]
MKRIAVISAYTFIEAIRNRIVWLTLALVLAAFTLSEFLAGIAITESQAFRSALFGALLRITSVLMLSFFVVSTAVREANDKSLHLLLSLPMPRASYILGKLGGFALLALVVAVACGVALGFYAPPSQAALWAASLWCELLLVIGFSVLCVVTFNQVTSALCAVVLFYFVSRAIVSLQLMADGPFNQVDSLGQSFIDGFVWLLRWVLPDLSKYSQSEWLVYHTGDWSVMTGIALSTMVYLAVLVSAALFDLYRRNL